MLSQITIKNFAIIDFLEINFKEGLTVLTGETGAGKSIIADALDFLLGARTTSDLIRSSADKAQVEGTFLVPEKFFLEKFEPWFKKNSFDNNSENVINVSRELTANGSKARINGSLSNVSHLLYLKEILVDIHEQSEHIELLKIEKQMDILDNCGNDLHKKILEEYGKTYEEYISLKNRLNIFKRFFKEIYSSYVFPYSSKIFLCKSFPQLSRISICFSIFKSSMCSLCS